METCAFKLCKFKYIGEVASFYFFYFTYLFLEKSFLHISLWGWGGGELQQTHFYAILFFSVEFGLLFSLTCCVSLLSDQAMLTFVQTNLIKLKKNAFYLRGLHCVCRFPYYMLGGGRAPRPWGPALKGLSQGRGGSLQASEKWDDQSPQAHPDPH